MPIDRETSLRQAEKLNREGKIDLAIAEYVRLVEGQPRDWNSINALGDLYLRAGDVDRAVAQFIQIADHLFGEGFFPKAAAVYKKALKAKPEYEHALLKLADIAAAQELLADARAYLRRLWELRSGRGDDDGAAECLVRLASLPEADIETRLTGARAARLCGDAQRAASLFRSAAEDLEQAGRTASAIEVLAQVVALEPADVDLRRRLAGQYVAVGQLDDAAQLLDEETVGSDPDLLLTLASLELTRRNDESARAALTRLVGLAPDRSDDVLRLAGELGRAGEPHRAFACTTVVVDEAVLKADWDRAIAVLQSFLVHGSHVPALVKLVHVSEEAGVAEILLEAQERLVEAYLEEGSGPEARALAEELLARAPGSTTHAQRLRRAAELAGDADPDETVRRVLDRFAAPAVAEVPDESVSAIVNDDDPPAIGDVSDESGSLIVIDDDLSTIADLSDESASIFVIDDDLSEIADQPAVVSTDDSFHEDVVRASAPPSETFVASEAEQPTDPVDIDLSDIVAGLGASAVPISSAQPSLDDSVADLSDLDAVLNSIRPRGADYQGVTEAAGAYERGVQRIERGQVKEGLEDLEEAAHIPAFRFAASARLGREYIKRGQAHEGIEWLERAAETPAPSRDAGLDVLYDLGVALESIGEGARALAVLMEVEADATSYRDVPRRIEVLARQEAERRG